MNRCLELAKLGAGNVAPNPMVGAVLVHQNRIIGEGYHEKYGGPHAEVNCIASVAEEDKPLIAQSTLYVSLEPCAHFGKTPPCADLIVEQRIPKVVIACRDIFAKVNGLGIQKLQQAGIEVITGVMEEEAIELNKRFFCFHRYQRPFVILKWAQSADSFIAKNNFEAVAISNEWVNRWVHKMRAEEAAIMVGFNTALYDNPRLTVRNYTGKNPVRIVIDKKLNLAADAAIKSPEAPLIIVNEIKHWQEEHITFLKIEENDELLPSLMRHLYQQKIQSVIVEGGAVLLQSFINHQLWDEAFCISNAALHLEMGIKAPAMPANADRVKTWQVQNNYITHFKNKQ